MKKTFAVGDKVGYNARFIRQVQLDGDTAALRGTVKEVKDDAKNGGQMARAVIAWSDGTESTALLIYLKHDKEFERFE